MNSLLDAAKIGPLAPQPLIDFANKITLRQPNIEVLRPDLIGRYAPIAHLLQNALRASERRKELLLPNLKDYTNAIAIFSDYGGDSVKYKSYSFLFTDYHVVTGPFAEEVATLRDRHKLGTKEISYKDLGFGPIKRSLNDFLNVADRLPGLLFTLLIEKNVNTLFGDQSDESKMTIDEAMNIVGLQKLKPKVVQRLLTITHCSAFLLSILSRENQKIFWMTDHDAICATKPDHLKMLDVFCRVIDLYSNGRRFDIVGGALPFGKDSIATLDGLSVADLAAGASSDLITQVETVGLENRRMKKGAEHLLMWLARHGLGLKKLSVVIRQQPAGLTSGLIRMTPKELPDGVLVVPLFVP